MTRKKWNRLRRQRPELFVFFRRSGWESLNRRFLNSIQMAVGDVQDVRKCSKAEVIAKLTYLVMEGEIDALPMAAKRTLVHNSPNAPKPYLTDNLAPW